MSAPATLTFAELGELFGEDRAHAAAALLELCRNRTLPVDVRERARRALLILNPCEPLWPWPGIAAPAPAPPPRPTPAQLVARDIADVILGAILAGDRRERLEAAGTLRAVCLLAASIRQRRAA